MKYAWRVFFATILGCAVAFAQGGNHYDGHWTARWQPPKGAQRLNEGVVVVAGEGGSFQNLHRNQRNPCVGLTAPISIKTASPDALIFVIEFSAALRGCRDSEVSLKRVDDKTLKGLRDGKIKVTLTRD